MTEKRTPPRPLLPLKIPSLAPVGYSKYPMLLVWSYNAENCNIVLVSVSQCLHSVHDRPVQTIRSLDQKPNTHPTIQSSYMRVLVPLLAEQLVHIDGGIAQAGAGDNDVLLFRRRHD